MKKTAIYILRFFLNIIYFFMKFRVTKPGKILFLSRQSNEVNLDFRMIQEELLKREPWLEIVTICNRLEGENSGGLVSFAKDTLRSMYHMANSGVVILDSYWPAVSLLKHKDDLTVIQIWHALGKIKKSGYQTLGKEGGRGLEVAKLMKMHRGYDYIIAGGKAWNDAYMASFGTTSDKLLNFGLPRIDYLLNTTEEKQIEIYKKYKEFIGKKVVLYAPTFRRNIKDPKPYAVKLMEAMKADDIVFIAKSHPNQFVGIPDTCPDFSTDDLLSIADYVITDYSATAVEAAILGVKTLYYVYDFEDYSSKNGMNINLYDEMPDCVFKDAEKIAEIIRTDDYNTEALRNYQEKFLPEELGTSTEKICNLIIENIK